MLENEQAAENQLPVQLFYVFTTRAEVIKVAVLGLLSGILVPFLAWLIADYFINPVFCANGGGGTMDICISGKIVAGHVAAVLVGLGAFILMLRWNIFRALLIAVASTIAVWGLAKYANPILSSSLLEYYAFSASLYMLAYFVFYWLLRIRSFPLSFMATALTVIGVCAMLVA